jgi:hypothetical protein
LIGAFAVSSFLAYQAINYYIAYFVANSITGARYFRNLIEDGNRTSYKTIDLCGKKTIMLTMALLIPLYPFYQYIPLIF